MKLKYKILIVLIIFLFFYWVYLSFLSYEYPTKEEIDKRINYLERVINQPLNKEAEVVKLGYMSSEFMLFSYAYSTYAFTSLIVSDSTYKERLVPLIKECIIKSMHPVVSFPYDIDINLLRSDSIPDYSVLYLGHLNLMLGCYRMVGDGDSFNQLNDNISASLFSRYAKTPYLMLASYPESIWIPDNTVGLASLKLHDWNADSGFGQISEQWVEYAKKNYLESETDVLYSTVDASTGKALEEARGSMLGWSIMFIYQFDSKFGAELYENYKEHFSDNFLALRLFRERANERFLSLSDIDSGPIFLGYSIPANEFALGPAILSGDLRTAKKIERLIGFGARSVDYNNELRYKVRFVSMDISPMAEALVLNSMVMRCWMEDKESFKGDL